MLLNLWKACSLMGLGSFLTLLYITMFRNSTVSTLLLESRLAPTANKPELLSPQAAQAPHDLEPASIRNETQAETEGNIAEVANFRSEEEDRVAQAPDFADYFIFNKKKPYEEKENYTETYSKMYAKGYHGDLTYSHERIVVRYLLEFDHGLGQNGAERIQGVIVLGCSHGWGVWQLYTYGYRAWGVDVSPQAIDMATRHRGRTCGQGEEPCFVRASLTNLPYSDGQFDAGMSSDVFEHLMPEDVPRLVEEVSRVVRRYLFLQIAVGADASAKKTGKGIHRTQKGPKWWTEKFIAAGWRVHKDMSKVGTSGDRETGVVRLVLIRNSL